MDKDTQAASAPDEKPEVSAGQTRLKRFRNGFIQFVVSTAVILVVTRAFETWADDEIVNKAKELQTTLDNAISAFDPNQIFSYIFYAWIYVVGVVIKSLYSALTLAFSPSAAATILNVAKTAIYPLCGAFVIALLPVVIVVEMMHGGHLLEGALAIGCWFSVFLVARLTVKKEPGRDRGFSFPLVEIIAVTFAFLWFVKLMMMGAALLNDYIVLARIAVAASTVGYWAHWSVMKITEHTVSEAAVDFAKKLVSIGLRHLD